MRVGVIGCGSIGQRHIKNLIALGVPAGDIYGADVRQEALDRLPDGVRCGGLVLGLPAALDAVLVCTPAHLRPLSEVAKLGKAVFIEKPVAMSTAALPDALVKQYESIPHLVACNMRFYPTLVSLKAWAQAHGSWRPKRAECNVRVNMRAWPGGAYASDLWECGYHELDLVAWLLGPFTLESAGRNNDGWWLECRHSEATSSGICVSGHEVGYTRDWTLEFGTSLRADAWSAVPGDANVMYVEEMRHFLAVARGEAKSCNTLAQAREIVRACEQAERMAAAV